MRMTPERRPSDRYQSDGKYVEGKVHLRDMLDLSRGGNQVPMKFMVSPSNHVSFRVPIRIAKLTRQSNKSKGNRVVPGLTQK